jgi:hypothetical protein
MARREPTLIVGPLLVVTVVVSAQCGAYALNAWPRSALLWYLNLEVFRPVQYSFLIGNGLDVTGASQAFCLVLAFLVLIGSGLFGKTRLPLAIASNLSFLYSVVLLYGFYAANSPALPVDIRLSALLGPSFALVTAVVLTALVSSASAHRAYWREIFSS